MKYDHDITVRLRWRNSEWLPKRVKQIITSHLPTIKLTQAKPSTKTCKWEYLGDHFWRPECTKLRNNGSGGAYCTYCGGKIKIYNWKEYE